MRSVDPMTLEAVLMALHPRLGAHSPLQWFENENHDLYRCILLRVQRDLERAAELKELYEEGSHPSTDGHYMLNAAAAGDTQGVQDLIDWDIDVDTQTQCYKETALMLAASKGHVSIVKALIRANASLDLRNSVSYRIGWRSDV